MLVARASSHAACSSARATWRSVPITTLAPVCGNLTNRTFSPFQEMAESRSISTVTRSDSLVPKVTGALLRTQVDLT